MRSVRSRWDASCRRARKRRGLTQEEAARLLQVARTTIVAIEKGERRIKAPELVRLAEAYGCQVGDFVRPRPAVEPFQVQFRAPLSLAGQADVEVQPSIALFEELCRNYLELEEITGTPLPSRYPPEYPVAGLRPNMAAEDFALRERNRLALGDGPLPVLRDILEQDLGLRVFYLDIKPSKYSEMYYYSDQLGGCIAINRQHPEDRRRWSLAHGYCHFLANRYTPVVAAPGSYRRLSEAERLADAFAANFLMPASGLKRRFADIVQATGKITPGDLLFLANYYGVSLEALVRRLEDIRLLRKGIWDKLRDSDFRVRETQAELGLPEIPMRDDELPRRYVYLAIQALDRGLISEGQLARFLRKDRIQTRQIAEAVRQGIGEWGASAGADLTQPVDL